jgi:lactate permease
MPGKGCFVRGFKRWLIRQATADIRVQTMLMAWAFGALMEGLVGFGYPWAVVAPILIVLGMADLAAIRVAAIANNARCPTAPSAPRSSAWPR